VISHDPSESLNPKLIPDLPLGTRQVLFKQYVYRTSSQTEVASLVQHRFFDIGNGYKSPSAFLTAAMNSHTYQSKIVERITDVGAGDQEPRRGVMHESTGDRLKIGQIKKEHRAESKRRRLTTSTNVNTGLCVTCMYVHV